MILPVGAQQVPGVLPIIAAVLFLGCGGTPTRGVKPTSSGARPPSVDSRALEGAWLEVLDQDPQRARRRSRAQLTLVISGAMLVESLTDRTVRQSLFTHVSGRDDAIDLTTVVDGEFWLTRAIYKIDNDILTICEATRDAPRPTVFRQGAGEDAQLTSLRKLKRL
jgi:hypothetical protein